MTEERLSRVEATLDTLVVGQVELRRDMEELRIEVKELRADVDQLKADVRVLRVDADQLKADVRELRDGQIDLRRHMGVLHEEVIANIKALALPMDEIQRQIREGDALVREELGARLDVVEAALKVRRRQRRGR